MAESEPFYGKQHEMEQMNAEHAVLEAVGDNKFNITRAAHDSQHLRLQ